MNHWIAEYRHEGLRAQFDSEIMAGSAVTKPEDPAADLYASEDFPVPVGLPR